MIQEILKIKIDFDALEEWRDSDRDDIPVTNFIGLYKALGIVKAANDYKQEHSEFEVIPMDNIFCNTSTHRRLKAFIEKMWSIYSLSVDADNHVFWDTRKWAKGKKHYSKKISNVVKASLAMDFSLYCPGIDDSLGVNEIVLGIYIPDEEMKEEADA